MFFLRYISASIIYFTRILKNVRNSVPFLLKFKQKFNSPFPLRYSFSSCKASGAHAALQLQKYREKQASFLHHAGADTAKRTIQTAERRYRFPCRITGKIKVCSGHQFLTRLSRLFLFLLFIAFKSFVHRDFADFSVKRQTDDGIYHDTDEKHLRKQRRLYVEREPAGKLLHHKLVDNL